MIDYKGKFIFIHVYKVAGTSIRSVLQKRSITARVKNKILRKVGFKEPEGTQLRGHATAKEYMELLGREKYNEFFTFGFTRNPFDWQVSLYEYARQSPDHFQHELHLKMSFDAYIDWRCDNNYSLQKDFLYVDDNCAVNFIGKFETIHEDFSEVCRILKLKAPLEHKKRSRRTAYSDCPSSGFLEPRAA